MKPRGCIPVALSLLLTACSDTSSPISQPTGPDEVLRQAILGDWNEYEYYSVSFRPDGTFADTTFGAISFNYGPLDTMYLYRSGNFLIQDSVVSFLNVQFGYTSSSGKPWPGFSDSPIPQLLRLDANGLQMTPTTVLTRVLTQAPDTGIYGTWSSTTWMRGFHADSLNPQYVSRLECVYIFDRQSSTCSETRNYLDYAQIPSQTSYGSYEYSPPHLLLKVFWDTTQARVVFSPSHMYWIYDQWRRSLHRPLLRS